MNFLKTIAAVIVAQFLIFCLFMGTLAVFGLASRVGGKPKVPESGWLVLDIYGDIPSYNPPETISLKMFESPETLRRILQNLQKAAVDDRIKGVIVKVSSSNSLGGAKMQEIRGAIGKVRDAGKPVYAWSDALNRASLFLASACDSVYMAPAADLTLLGMGVVREYYKGTLDKLGVHADIHRIREYKSAAEPFMRKNMSPEAREMATWLLGDIWDQQINAIATARKITKEALEKNMERALFTAREARNAGLVDGVLYYDQLKDRLKGDSDQLTVISSSKYDKVTPASVGLAGRHRIAVIHAWGMIGGRKSRVNPMMGAMIGHDTVVRELRRAADDDHVDAVVFRVDSPGGESLASEIIANEVARVREKKPIIVSMEDVAASGGYSISYKATRIVADPMTITGSIGSISGKFNTKGMYEKLGFSFDWVTKGPNALMYSPVTDFTPAQRKLFEANHWAGFNRWLNDIAHVRHIKIDKLKKLAYGRVWTGRQARKNGLIDELGGLDRAVEIAREEAGIDSSATVSIVHYPRKKGILSLLTGSRASTLSWMVYHTSRAELAETARFFSGRPLALWTGRVVQ